jgi:hypothetical protein
MDESLHNNDLISLTEFGRIVGVTRQAASKWRERGLIAATKVADRWCVSRTQANEIAKERAKAQQGKRKCVSPTKS